MVFDKLKGLTSSKPMESRSQPLSSKDRDSFQLALSLYEKKEYEKSLAQVEQIIKRRKEKLHGESLCLKALLLYHLKKDGEDVERMMNQGCTLDSKSHVAWHMAGIYHKLRKEFAKAFKRYHQSFKLNRENANVHHDLAMTAAQVRDYPTLVETRRQMLGMNMSVRLNWTGLVAALFVAKDYKQVDQTVLLYEQIMSIEQSSSKKKQTAQEKLADDVETSEMLMLRNKAIMKQGQYEKVLTNLTEIKSRVLDKLAWLEAQAEALTHTSPKQARSFYLDLLKRNPANLDYYKQIEKIDEDMVSLYKELETRFPKADLPLSRPLHIFSAESSGYKERVKAYLQDKLVKQVPSTFKLVESLYSDDAKRAVLCQVVSELDLIDKPGMTVGEAIFLARHYASTGDVEKGVQLLENFDIGTSTKKPEILNDEGGSDPVSDEVTSEALDLEIDFKLAFAELLQLSGAHKEAANLIDELSERLPGDRALNTRAAHAMLRANDIEKGYSLIYKFPIWGKHAENDTEALNHMIGLESVNTVTAMAQSHFRRREHGLALKRSLQVMGIFQAYFNEQYDFHFYGPKRATLRQYIDLLSWEDTLYSHPLYFEVVKIAVAEWCAFSRSESDGLSENELATRKRQRASKLDSLDLKTDDDPFGIAALEDKNGLGRAFDAWKLLENCQGADPNVWWLGFQILLAQKKYVLANQALKKARDFGVSSSKVAAGGLMARHTLENDGQAPQVLRSLQLKMLPTVVSEGDIVNADPSEYANTYVTDLLDWISVRRFIGCTDGVESQVIAKLEGCVDSATAEQAYLEVQKIGSCKELAQAIHAKWPRASFTTE